MLMTSKKYKFTFIDLFSGIGGFKMALESNSGKCLGFSEINTDAISTYCENFNESSDENLGDIKKIKELPSHDLLTAGVPCQSWSIAGKNLGFDDDRGQLWNDTIYLLQQSKPKAFIFENVKGLVDPRNKEALGYILKRIKQAGYYADYHVINSHDYGVPQNRIRVYIIGFKSEEHFLNFAIPSSVKEKIKLSDVLGVSVPEEESSALQKDLFGEIIPLKSMSLSSSNGINDYFLFNDLRNGDTTIHSWDILSTTARQKDICYLLLKNRRKKLYGKLDGNPLSLENFQSLDSSIKLSEINKLIDLEILKEEEYLFSIEKYDESCLSKEELIILDYSENGYLNIDTLKSEKSLRVKRIKIKDTFNTLKEKNIVKCCEIRYDFKNTKISTGLFGVNRIFLPTSNVFPTLVASDTNDYVTDKFIDTQSPKELKKWFLKNIYKKDGYRKITKEEACLIQGFPDTFLLPQTRARWMKLIGNSVSVPVIEKLCEAIIESGAFEKPHKINKHLTRHLKQGLALSRASNSGL
ncbi:MAG: DNA (cytosine-5-)-methyltransferase [Cocleimonas sp.]